ncbi:hypothetical protein AX14_010215 [Amanita brunnescens Koide BX004]|nr:hypothetical protein AX14_010215 [Amanita brunnescens Koide BX004]
MSAALRSPLHTARPMTTRRSVPVSPKGAILPRLTKDKSSPTVPKETKTPLPIRAKAVNMRSTSTGRSAPMASTAARVLPKASTSILSRRSAPPRPPNDKRKPLVKMAAAQRKSSVVSTEQTTSSKEARQITETHTRAPVASHRSGDFPSSNSPKKSIGETIQLRRADEDDGCSVERPEGCRNHSFECSNKMQGPTTKQARPSLLSGEMGERRRAYDPIVNKINNKNIESHLPEGSATLSSLPTVLSGSTPQTSIRLMPNKRALTPTSKQQGPIVAISTDKETSANRHLPEAEVAPTLPIHSPALPVQVAALHQPSDEGLLPAEMVPKRRGLHVVNTKPLSSDTHSLKVETARKQSESVKNPSFEGEGKYLERAAAYVRERMSRRTPACDTFEHSVTVTM